jgi:hypothetical protein
MALFRFTQFEFPWALGPADGRYVVRGSPDADPEHVVVLATLGAERRHLRRSSRSRRAAPTPPAAPVSVARATIIDAAPLSGETPARAWLAKTDAEVEAEAALAVLDRLIYAQRIATADPYVHELSTQQALAVRVGWGEGEQVADGRWRDARELPPETGRRARRSAVLRPQERLALLLGARHEPLLGEELALRARLDLDHGRPRLAALELRGAYDTLLPALAAEERADLTGRVRELQELAAGVEQAAQSILGNAARPAGPPETSGPAAGVDEAALAHALGRLEAALRARAAAGFAPAWP